MPSPSQPEQRLALMQLSDSFFPSGSFTLSHGLESLVQSGQVRSADGVQTFLSLLLQYKIGPSDLVALTHAYRASEQDDRQGMEEADRQLFARTLLQEVREVQHRSGRALLMVASATWPDPQLEWFQHQVEVGNLPGLHPVVFAGVARAAGLDERDALYAFAHSFLTGICGAAIRLGVLGHLGAQQVLREVAADVEAIVQRAQSMPLEEMWSCLPTLDIAQMNHKHLPQRLFSN